MSDRNTQDLVDALRLEHTAWSREIGREIEDHSQRCSVCKLLAAWDSASEDGGERGGGYSDSDAKPSGQGDSSDALVTPSSETDWRGIHNDEGAELLREVVMERKWSTESWMRAKAWAADGENQESAPTLIEQLDKSHPDVAADLRKELDMPAHDASNASRHHIWKQGSHDQMDYCTRCGADQDSAKGRLWCPGVSQAVDVAPSSHDVSVATCGKYVWCVLPMHHEGDCLAADVAPDLDYLHRATAALRLELPAAVYDDYAWRVLELITAHKKADPNRFRDALLAIQHACGDSGLPDDAAVVRHVFMVATEALGFDPDIHSNGTPSGESV